MAEVATETRPPGAAAIALKRIAIVPAFNEQESVTHVIEEIRAFDPDFEVVVVDDGSTDGTAAAAARLGAHVVRLPFNLGIGGAVQTGFRYAFEHGFELAVRVDGDGQHDPAQLGLLLGPVVAGEADIVVGSRFASDGGYRSSRSRRVGISILAKTVSLLVRRRVTDPTSGFQALNRRAIALFAADYPHDYPEVEAALMVHKHELRMTEVPVHMRERSAGQSSIGALASVYYMVKVLLALFVGLFRKNVTPLEEAR
ncbi:MAG TPA: glycosyltransferase family 2 protein [Gaiellaceae bacterium]|nr:glycosyltransferase family 2 protein [Gaiellaceae bacterium]